MRYRSRLSRDSDVFAGLTLALEQLEPNGAWCAGLTPRSAISTTPGTRRAQLP
ncbi:MAG TPA: hypothetical protein VJ793_24155 [Anaerolineae bacterium]|nr:hypothetical protein [Anaerolineae bacterium]